MIEAGNYVQLEKVGFADDPIMPTPSWDDYTPGEENKGVSVPIEYTVTGYLATDPQIGGMVLIHRDSRNGVRVDGMLQTSRITQCLKAEHETLFTTNNSKYRLTKLNPPVRTGKGDSKWGPQGLLQ